MSSNSSDVVIQDPLLLCDMGDCPAQATVTLEFGHSWLRMCAHHAYGVDPEGETQPKQDQPDQDQAEEKAGEEIEQQTA